ncbi:MAG: lipoyl(octanoyl) transferase LipB, partial [Nitrospira sp.]|nr:lipoyl(octanoyl) transferase LipB [Nitrospira sp.]
KQIICHAIERGGSVTYHGPGQLVGYPILRLRKFCQGPKLYVQKLEEVLIRTLAEWGMNASRHDQHRGVWAEGAEQRLEKIASIGVRVDRGITMHGFALNVNVDLHPFTLITPCGIEGVRVTSMAKVLGKSLDVETVQEMIIRKFSDVFDLPFPTTKLL